MSTKAAFSLMLVVAVSQIACGDPRSAPDSSLVWDGGDSEDSGVIRPDAGVDAGVADVDADTLILEDLCGNGVTDIRADGGFEECDDGNGRNADGCSSDCHFEPGGSCPGDGGPCTRCGNGILEAGEACDDGNLVDNDGCSDSCQVEPG